MIISPLEMNKSLKTVIIAPLTSTLRDFPTRLDVVVKRNKGQIVLDQLRTVDKDRLGAKVSKLSEAKSMKVKRILLEIFQ